MYADLEKHFALFHAAVFPRPWRSLNVRFWWNETSEWGSEQGRKNERWKERKKTETRTVTLEGKKDLHKSHQVEL